MIIFHIHQDFTGEWTFEDVQAALTPPADNVIMGFVLKRLQDILCPPTVSMPDKIYYIIIFSTKMFCMIYWITDHTFWW